jgi:hypothetical protein
MAERPSRMKPDAAQVRDHALVNPCAQSVSLIYALNPKNLEPWFDDCHRPCRICVIDVQKSIKPPARLLRSASQSGSEQFAGEGLSKMSAQSWLIIVGLILTPSCLYYLQKLGWIDLRNQKSAPGHGSCFLGLPGVRAAIDRTRLRSRERRTESC